jgi:hypothetical protein
MSVVLRVQLVGPIEDLMPVAVRRALRAVLVRAFVSAVNLGTNRTPNLASARRLLVSGRTEHGCSCPQQVVYVNLAL